MLTYYTNNVKNICTCIYLIIKKSKMSVMFALAEILTVQRIM